jgi:uncharacterized protein YqeY
MSTKVDLVNALKDAMRSGDDTRKRVLRSVLTELKLAEVERGQELNEPEILALLQKQVKSRQETISDAEKAGRPDLGEDAGAEIAVLEAFLPRPYTQGELEQLVEQVVADVGASGPGDMGKVMKAIMPKVRGRADGGEVNRLVRATLQEK